VNTGFLQGALMVIDDHINLIGTTRSSAQTTSVSARGFRYDRGVLGTAAQDRRPDGQAMNLTLPTGCTSPSSSQLQTPAEIRYLRTIGADAVGMSTVPEAIVRATWPRGARHLVHHQHGGRRAAAAARSRRGDGDGSAHRGSSSRCWRGLLSSSERRLSVTLVDVRPGGEEFLALAVRFEALLIRKEYGRAETIRDEAQPLRFYAVRHWSDVAPPSGARRSGGADAHGAAVSAAHVTHVVNGVRRPDTTAKLLTGRRGARRSGSAHGFDRRQPNLGRRGERRIGVERRLARGGCATAAATPQSISWPRPGVRERTLTRRSRISRSARRSRRRWLGDHRLQHRERDLRVTICAERVAMFKALSDGHRAFTELRSWRIRSRRRRRAARAADSVGVRRQPRRSISPI